MEPLETIFWDYKPYLDSQSFYRTDNMIELWGTTISRFYGSFP